MASSARPITSAGIAKRMLIAKAIGAPCSPAALSGVTRYAASPNNAAPPSNCNSESPRRAIARTAPTIAAPITSGQRTPNASCSPGPK